MRKLYNEFFYIPKHGKVREKVVLVRVAMTVVIMVMCLLAMSLTAYAYFSYNVTSGSNTIKAANFETNIQVQITDTDGTAVDSSEITPITSDHKKFRVEGLQVGKWYKVTIKPTDRNTAQTGFIIVSAKGSEVTYHTQQLGIDKNVAGGKTPEIRFKLMITDATDVIFESHWGTSSYYPAYQIESVNDERYITLDEEIKMIINDKDTNEGFDDENKEPEDTTPSTNATTGTDSSSTQTSEGTTTPSTETEATTPETIGTSEPTGTTELSTSTTEPTTTQPTETTATDTTEASE